MNWVQINERLLALEAKEKKYGLTIEDIREWNKMIESKVTGILVRHKKDEENIGKAETAEQGEASIQITDAGSIH